MKVLVTFIPVAIGSLLLYRLKISKKESDDTIEYPPVSPVGIIQSVKMVLSPDYPLQLLALTRQMDCPVYLFKSIPPHKIYISDDVHVTRQILKDEKTTKPTVYKVLQDALHNGGDDILTSDGSFWKHSRKAMAPAFSSSHLKRMTETVNRKTENFIKNQLDPMVEKGESIDICKEMINLTLSIISETAFEYEMSGDEQETFVKGVAITLAEAVKCMVFPFRSRFGKYILPEAKRAYMASMKLTDLGDNILKSYRAMGNPIKGTVIDQIAQNKSYKTDKERISDLLTLLFAGHDTTGVSLSWILLELARNPHEQRLLRKELRSHPEEDRSSLKMLRNVVKEGMRLHPVAPMQPRVVKRNIIIKREGHSKDFLIPKKSVVICSNILLGRNEKYFKDPDNFIPSRWEDASDDAISAVMPFSLGKRNCVGQSLAMIELHCVLARLCSDYDFSIEEEGVLTYYCLWKPSGARLVAKKVNN